MLPSIPLILSAPRLRRATLQEAGIVPGASPLTPVVDSVCAGSPVTLEVAFGARRLARDGEVLAPGQAAETPTVKIHGGTPGKLYMLANVDPDAPGEAQRFSVWRAAAAHGASSASCTRSSPLQTLPTPSVASGCTTW